VVWARGQAAAEECPKSLITPESVMMVERYWAWSAAGGGDLIAMTAREAEAVLTLEQERRKAADGIE
jgi:hypothetical protein